MEETDHANLNEIAATLGVIGAIAVGTVDPAAAWYGYHHRYYNYYGGGTWNGCPSRWTMQGGVCKPYHYGPWDWYGHRNWYGYR